MEQQDQNQLAQIYRRAFDQFFDLFITPEVKRRQETGELETPLDLRAAQIVFFPDGRKPQVRINSEVKAIGKMSLKPGVAKNAGDPVFENEIDGLEEINLADDDTDCGHAAVVKIGGSWALAFDFIYNKALSRRHIERADEFYELAKFAHDQKYWAAFVDNLYSAAELLARAVLLSIADPEFRKKSTHKAIQIRYNRFADIGNIDPLYRDTFNKLYGLRDEARYLKDEISISGEEANDWLSTVKSMLEDAKRLVRMD